MKLNVNGTILVDDFKNIDFNELSIGQQIFLFEEKEYYNSLMEKDCKYNNITTFHLKNCPIPEEIYCFDKLGSEFSIYEYEGYDTMSVEYDDETISYLRLKNDLVPIESIEELDEIVNAQDCDLKHIDKLINASCGIRTPFSIQDSLQSSTEHGRHFVNYYAVINLKNSKLGICIEYDIKPSNHRLYKSISLYIFNKDFTKYSEFSITRKSLPRLIDALKNNFSSMYSNNCVNHLLTFMFTASKIRTDRDSKQIMISALSPAYFGHDNIYSIIDNFIRPLIEDHELGVAAYYKDFVGYAYPNISIEYLKEYQYGNEEYRNKLDLFSKKARAIAEFLTDNSDINIYTGDVINTKVYTETYRDSQYLILTNSNNYKTIYEKIDNIYIKPDDRQKALSTVQDRIDIMNKLTQGMEP